MITPSSRDPLQVIADEGVRASRLLHCPGGGPLAPDEFYYSNYDGTGRVSLS